MLRLADWNSISIKYNHLNVSREHWILEGVFFVWALHQVLLSNFVPVNLHGILLDTSKNRRALNATFSVYRENISQKLFDSFALYLKFSLVPFFTVNLHGILLDSGKNSRVCLSTCQVHKEKNYSRNKNCRILILHLQFFQCVKT